MKIKFSRLDLRQIKNIIDQRKQMMPARLNDLQSTLLMLAEPVTPLFQKSF
jgi:hypothetical protein